MKKRAKRSFIKKSSYALSGFKDILSTEGAFRIELVFGLVFLPIIFLIDIDFLDKVLLFFSYMFVLIAEAINSAIERVVDLVTSQYNEMAKRAKDVGSTIVFLSIFTAIITWIVIITNSVL